MAALLKKGERALLQKRIDVALSAFTEGIGIIEDAHPVEERMPANMRAFYGHALVQRARALAVSRDAEAISAYLHARLHTELKPADISFVGGRLLKTLPRSMFAFPLYLEWYENSADKARAEERIREAVAIDGRTDPSDSAFATRRQLNEYLGAQKPNWLWTLQHLAVAHELMGDLDAAHTILLEWSAREPSNSEVRCRERMIAGRRHQREDQPIEAAEAYQAAMLMGSPLSHEAAERVLDIAGLTEFSDEDTAAVDATFRQYLHDATTPALLLRYAEWAGLRDADAETSTLYRVLELEPGHADALRRLATRSHEQGDVEEASRLLTRYLEARPLDRRARLMASEIADGACDWARVIELLQDIEERTPTHDLLYAKALTSLGRLRQAEVTLAGLTHGDLSDEEGYVLSSLKVDCALANGAFDAALAQCADLMQRDPDDLETLARLGRAHLGVEEWAEASDAFSRVLDADASVYEARRGRGEAYYRLGKRDEAASDFRAALADHPRQPQIHYAVALCALDTDVELARAHLSEALEQDPAFDGAWLAIARVHERTEDWAAASEAYARALALRDNSDGVIEQRRTYAALRAGHHDIARAHLEARRERIGLDPTHLYYLGYCWYRAGDVRETAQHWRTSLRQREDDALRDDLAWLHLRLADDASEAENRVTMTQHWNIAQEYGANYEVQDAIVARWAREAMQRLSASGADAPAQRDVQIANDLMANVLRAAPRKDVYVALAGLCAARMGDWQLVADVVTPIVEDGDWAHVAGYLLGICRWEQNYPDRAADVLSMTKDWGEWETEAQSLRVQMFVDSGDVAGAARELAMLRVMSPAACPVEDAIALLLNMRCWRQVHDLVQETPDDDRTDLMYYCLGIATLMSNKETEGLDYLEQVNADTTWHAAAQELLRVGYKRQALRAFQSLGWEDVVGLLEQVAAMDETDAAVQSWLERSRDFALLSRWEAMDRNTLVDRWQSRLFSDVGEVLPLHQWAIFAFWDAQALPTKERWRDAISLWGTLVSLRDYWDEWALSRLQRHDPNEWDARRPVQAYEAQLQPVLSGFLARLARRLMTEMVDSLSQSDTSEQEANDLRYHFERERQTADLWRDWLSDHPHLADSVVPYGDDLLHVLRRSGEMRDILTTSTSLHSTRTDERLLIYLSPVGHVLAALESGADTYARDRARAFFDDDDPSVQRYARIVFVLASQIVTAFEDNPREGLETTLDARILAEEVKDSRLLESLAWDPLLIGMVDAAAADLDRGRGTPPDQQAQQAGEVRELLKRAYEITRIERIAPAIVRTALVQARALVSFGGGARRSVFENEFNQYDAQALDLLHETLALAPDNVVLQQETAQLRLRRGLVAADAGRINDALIDFARAHELDPVSHIITTTYANFMMEQAGQMWMDPDGDAQREALSLAHRVLSANPSDTQLLARCSRFLDLPQTHALRQAPEYRRLATLFMNMTQSERHAEG
ncbi:tetratricopeptide repeat protein [Candidatus Poribacteria bacterium]|nr:tetratricopeptide repeat protein [Candidatus Poribacteria bacterium]MBT5710113.1 tetratricopeptide repeat protein [Candidatus Poribacteria bacterium]MBT7099230.1 tetratricopeptide repeat protein [Candidatus Poribacteria bacterium]MBT7803936.1 tetratricopeptide repeat protein [Candidatus Poribacteria bacterium]